MTTATAAPVELQNKANNLLSKVDLTQPQLASIASSAHPAQAFVAHLSNKNAPRFLFEIDQKIAILAFLRQHYARWRTFDTTAAQKLADLPLADVGKPRILAGIGSLGQAWWATGDPAWGERFERFYLQTRTGEVFNWYSFNGTQGELELIAFMLLRDCPGLSAAGRVAFLDHLHAIADDAWDTHTSRWSQLSLGPEGHNWYLHGVQMLPAFGLVFPEFKRSDFFVRTAVSVVEEHVRGHLKSDGGARETAIGYQLGSMCKLWDFYTVCHRNGYPLSAGLADRLLNASLFLLRLMSPQGGLPSFGDGGHGPGDLTRLAAQAAALTGDRECKWYAQYCRQFLPGNDGEAQDQIPLAAFWSVGLEGAQAYAQTRARDPHLRSVLMGPTGYAALRDPQGPAAGYIAIAAADRGPIVTSHGHNDILALEVHANGTRFLGEMGCAPYGDSAGRLYDIASQAHNVLEIEGEEQVDLVSEWRWNQTVVPCVRRWISEPTHDYFVGVHEGFYHWPRSQTLHARKVVFIKSTPTQPGYAIVLDWIETNVENTYRINFHGCVPGQIQGKAIVLRDAGQQLAIVPPAGDALELVHDANNPGLQAYIAEKKLDASRYPAFYYRQRGKSSCFAWVIAPGVEGSALPQVTRVPVQLNGAQVEAVRATAVEVKHADGRRDLLCVSHADFDAQLDFASVSSWGHLALRRFDAQGNLQLTIDHTMPDGIVGR